MSNSIGYIGTITLFTLIILEFSNSDLNRGLNSSIMDGLNLEQRLKKLEERVERLKEVTFNNLGDIELSIFNLEDKLSLINSNNQNNVSHTQNLVSNNNLTNLTEIEKRVLEMRKQGYTQRAIAESTLTTEPNISQVMKKIRIKLIKERDENKTNGTKS